MSIIATTLAVVPSAATVSTLATENWAISTPTYFNIWAGSTSDVWSGVNNAEAWDGKGLQLQLGASPTVGPSGGATAGSINYLQYGTFKSRVRSANCWDTLHAGVATGILFTYGHNGSDNNGNGIEDNSEIDFENLCAQPEVLYLSVYTDYEGSQWRLARRVVNIKTGTIIKTCLLVDSFDCIPPPAGGLNPASFTAIPDFAPHEKFYEYGFTWASDRVTFWIKTTTGVQIDLWDFQGGVDLVPQQSARLFHNVWHTDTWTPPGQPQDKEQPQNSTLAWVDWTKIITG